MWYTLDQDTLICSELKKKKKAVAMVKHRKPCAQTQEYPKYTQTAVEIQKPLCTNTRASKINTQVSMLIP